MGLFRFQTPQRDRISNGAVDLAYVTGIDGIPMPCCKAWESESVLLVEREVDDSGCFAIPWRVAGHGELMLSTATLMERPRAYHLPVELARGTLNRLRTKAEVWKLAGLNLPPELAMQLRRPARRNRPRRPALNLPPELAMQLRAAASSFILAATSQHETQAAAEAAEETIRLSLDAVLALGDEYARQVLAFRHQESAQLATLLAGNLGGSLMPPNCEPMFKAAFNAAVVPLKWKNVQPTPDTWQWTPCDKQMQWCRRHGMKVLAGPLLRLDRDCLPEWVVASAGNYDALAGALRKFITAAVDRYRGEVHLWHCAAGTNVANDLSLSDDHRLRLTVLAIETLRRRDARTPLFVSFDQPWAEYMVREPTELFPLHMADMLVRADLGVAALGLEINYGYWPGGTYPRDLVEINEHVDFWSLLGLPLIVQLTVPSGLPAQPAAGPEMRRALDSMFPEGLSPNSQKRFVERLLPMLVAKQCVQAVVWNHTFDSAPGLYPSAGLFDAADRPKPALSSLIALRRDHVG